MNSPHLQILLDLGRLLHLDLPFDNQGNFIVASWRQGLISISPNRQVTVLVPDGKIIDGKPFGYADGIAIARDGKFTIHYSLGKPTEGEKIAFLSLIVRFSHD